MSQGSQGHSFWDYASTLSGGSNPACPDGVNWDAGTKPTCMVLGPITDDHCANANCHSDATCINRLHDFVCECNPGFSGDGRNNCDALPVEDECALGTDTCAPVGGVCEDTQYSFSCSCDHGFVDQNLQIPGTQCDACCYSFEILGDHQRWFICNDTMTLGDNGKHVYECEADLNVVDIWEPWYYTPYFLEYYDTSPPNWFLSTKPDATGNFWLLSEAVGGYRDDRECLDESVQWSKLDDFIMTSRCLQKFSDIESTVEPTTADPTEPLVELDATTVESTEAPDEATMAEPTEPNEVTTVEPTEPNEATTTEPTDTPDEPDTAAPIEPTTVEATLATTEPTVEITTTEAVNSTGVVVPPRPEESIRFEISLPIDSSWSPKNQSSSSKILST